MVLSLPTGCQPQSFQRFITIIDENRKDLDRAQVKELATGQIFTADQAKANGLIDEIGDEEAALEALQTKLGLSKARVVQFSFPVSLMDLLLGSAQARDPETQFRKLLEMSSPRAPRKRPPSSCCSRRAWRTGPLSSPAR